MEIYSHDSYGSAEALCWVTHEYCKLICFGYFIDQAAVIRVGDKHQAPQKWTCGGSRPSSTSPLMFLHVQAASLTTYKGLFVV